MYAELCAPIAIRSLDKFQMAQRTLASFSSELEIYLSLLSSRQKSRKRAVRLNCATLIYS